MQYWKPEAADEFAGDMMPFWDGDRFHLFYLLDRNHHAEQGGLGGHQWAHVSTRDLRDWRHHPLAVPVGAPWTADQHGICTGSIFKHEGLYHAFYATRIKRPDDSVYEALCRAESTDLIHFDKSSQNPLFTAEAGLDPRNFRDPFVFRHPETGQFHLLVTSSRERTPDFQGEGGVLAHYVSDDLEHWQAQGPFLPLDADPIPECPEHFFWNGWWYLVYSQSAQLQYWLSRDPLGPWQRGRRRTIEAGPNLSVPRTAAFTDGRRLAVGFLPWRRDGRDDGNFVYAGSVVFRELLQEEDGTLATRFVSELMPETGLPIPVTLRDASTHNVREGEAGWTLDGDDGLSVAHIPEVPVDCTIAVRLSPSADYGAYGLLLRIDEALGQGYQLCFAPQECRVYLRRWPEEVTGPAAVADDVDGLDETVEAVVCMKDSIIDVCINGKRTLIERCFERHGTILGVFTRGGTLCVEDLRLAPIR